MGSAIVAGGVFAQEQKAKRRETIKKAAQVAAGVAVEKVQNGVLVHQGQHETFTGRVAVLQGKPSAEPQEVNNGGLVVVRVPDSDSRSPRDIKVDAGQEFQQLGELHGVSKKSGKSESGGYTWILLKPLSEGEATVAVSFTPNGGGEGVKREYNVKVTAANAVESQSK